MARTVPHRELRNHERQATAARAVGLSVATPT